MATPQNNSYSGASGVPIAGGRFKYPAWRRAIAKDTWGTIPQTTTLAALDPTLNPAHWTAGMDWGTRGMTAGLLSWTAADVHQGDYWIPVGGGHTDYGGNEPYKIRLLGTDNPSWQMVRPPTGSKLATPGPLGPGYPVTTQDGQEASQLYADGRIRARHTYHNFCVVPAVGARPACIVLTRLAAEFINSQTYQHGKSYKFDLLTGETSLFSNFRPISGQPNDSQSSNDGVAAYDSLRDIVWHAGHGTNRMIKLDMTTGVSTGSAATGFASGDTMVYVPGLDVMFIVKVAQFFDPATETFITPTVSGSYSTGLRLATYPGVGASWVPELGCICMWNNTSAFGEISTLTPTGTKSQPWVKGKLTLSPLNSVLPLSAPTNDDGIFNRFKYVPELKGFVMLQSTVGQLYFYAIA